MYKFAPVISVPKPPKCEACCELMEVEDWDEFMKLRDMIPDGKRDVYSIVVLGCKEIEPNWKLIVPGTRLGLYKEE